MRGLRVLPLLLVLVACSPLRGCEESQLTLRDDSRMPKWIPPALSKLPRNTIVVHFTFYSPLLPANNTVVKLIRDDGATLWEATGQSCWHPVTVAKRNSLGGLGPEAFPTYTYLGVNGQIEVLEQRDSGDSLSIVDDAALVKGALESTKCE
jgi:hypothetical protein